MLDTGRARRQNLDVVFAGGKEFSPELLQQLQQQAGTLSRRALAQQLCRQLSWLGPTGEPALMSARKALSQLHRLGHLPAPIHAVPGRRRCDPIRWPAPPTPLPQSLAELGPVHLVPISSRRSRSARVWQQIMTHHYLGAGPACGHQRRYLIECPLGYLGGLAFSAAALQLKVRDQFIGWSELCRRHHLHRIVNNSRFLLLPWVQVPQLASHVLGLCARSLAADWQANYGYAPLLLETFVDSERFAGACYSAAGWECLGSTTGRGRQDRQHQGALSTKTIWVKALASDWRQQLQAQPAHQRLSPRRRTGRLRTPPPPPRDWAEQEFGNAHFGDRRLSLRLVQLAQDFQARPTVQIPEACGTKAKTRAAYRFFDHPKVKLEEILAPHREQTLARMQSEPVVLALHDTSELDYTAHRQTTGLGPIGNHAPYVHGLELHPTLALSPSGVPLGLLDVQCWKRDPDIEPKPKRPPARRRTAGEAVKWLNGFAAVEAAQARCPQTRVVSVSDCESDMFELYLKAQNSVHRSQFLLRAYRPRQQAAGGLEVWSELASRAPAGTLQVQLPRRGNHRARSVELTVRFRQVEIAPPEYMKKGTAAVKLWAILVREETPPPPNTEAVEWMLLTNIPVETLEEAVEKVRWYGLRFVIEEYFRTLKSGCRIEDRQLCCGERLEKCLGVDLVVAWRILYLSRLARQTPEASAEAHFEVMEWKVLTALLRPPGTVPPQPPIGMREAVRRIAQTGGFLGRNSDGEPGVITLWRGLQHLNDMAAGFELALSLIAVPVSSNPDYG